MMVNLWELFFSVSHPYRTVFSVVMQILPTSTLKFTLHTLIHTLFLKIIPLYMVIDFSPNVSHCLDIAMQHEG